MIPALTELRKPSPESRAMNPDLRKTFTQILGKQSRPRENFHPNLGQAFPTSESLHPNLGLNIIVLTLSSASSTDNFGLHLKNIFASGELVKDSVTEKISATASDGKNYMTQFYNLDAVISVGYRVNYIRATQFRQWATSVLREYAIRG